MAQQNLQADLLRLQAEGWAVSIEAASRLLQEREHKETEHKDELRQLLLNTDLKGVADRALPAEINAVEAQPLRGPHVLQVTAAEDISRPPKGGPAGGGGKHRVLQLRLTDGKTTCKALEFRPAPNLDISHLAPGTKVKVINATIKLGVVLVDSKSIQVLGGRVDALAEPWEFQRKHGIAMRGPDALDPAEAQPPPFTPFIPGKSRAPHPSTLADIYTATAADQAVAAADGEAGPSGSIAHAGDARNDQPGQADAAQSSRRLAPESTPQEAAVLQQAREAGAAKQRLLAKLAEDESSASSRGGRRGGGRGRGRRRRGGFDDEDDDSAMTLEEFEAQRKAKLKPAGTSHVQQSDEELARQLQAQLDLEDGPLPPGLHFANVGAHAQPSARTSHSPGHQAEQTAADALRNSLFSFDRAAELDGGGEFGSRGRGRSRGGRGHGRRGRR